MVDGMTSLITITSEVASTKPHAILEMAGPARHRMPPKWGTFPSITDPDHRTYVRAFWRYLLGWEPSPPRPPSDRPLGRALRQTARAEIIDYRSATAAYGACTIYHLGRRIESPSTGGIHTPPVAEPSPPEGD